MQVCQPSDGEHDSADPNRQDPDGAARADGSALDAARAVPEVSQATVNEYSCLIRSAEATPAVGTGGDRGLEGGKFRHALDQDVVGG